MKLSSDFIKENQHFLRGCILYEVLQKTPIFSAYKNFCSTVGNDAMEYPDFEFWFYRFYHGNLDLHYNRSADPEPKALVDIPVVIMKKITQHLNPIERTRLRYMNHAIKAVADSFPPSFEKIEITVSNMSISWSLNNKNYLCGITVSSTRMQWILNNKLFACYKRGSGCIIQKPNRSKREESEENYIKKGTEKLTPVLKMPNIQVNHLSLKLFDATLYHDDLLSVPLNAKSAFIHGRSTNQVIQSLSAMNPGHLESINLEMESSREWDDYRRIFETDQFKQAKSVNFERAMFFNAEDLVKFSHLKSFKCYLRCDYSFQDVPRVRDILSTFEELESCQMEYFDVWTDSPLRPFAAALGAEIPIGPLADDVHLTITHRHQIPESNDVLEFKLKKKGYHCLVSVLKLRDNVHI